MREKIAIEGTEGEMPRPMLGDRGGIEDGQKLEKTAVELDKAVAGPEGMTGGRCQREAQAAVTLPHGVEIGTAEDEMVDAFHGVSP